MCIMRGIIATVTATRSHSRRRSYAEQRSKQIDLEGINKPLSIDIIYSRPHTKATACVASPAFPPCARTLVFGETQKRQSPYFTQVSKTAIRQANKCKNTVCESHSRVQMNHSFGLQTSHKKLQELFTYMTFYNNLHQYYYTFYIFTQV